MKIEQKAINVLRSITAETITNANSGHTGSSIGAATIMYALFKDHLIFSHSENNLFLNRDRFILSAGHLCPLLYTTLHMFGFPISEDDLKSFRKYGSITPGHPHYGETPGIEVTTGPLGQGVANGVGFAIAETMLAERFNVLNDPIFSNKTYVLVGDGCLMEGVALEAISLAGTLNLSNLILLYDRNQITIDGDLQKSNNEDIRAKFEAQGWNVLYVSNGNNYSQVTKAISSAKQAKKPTIIIFDTIIGYETKYEGQNIIHGKALSPEELAEYKKKLEIDSPPFTIPKDVRADCKQTIDRNYEIEMNWRRKVNLYSKTNPELFKQLSAFLYTKQIDVEKIVGNKIKDKKISGREANNKILNLVAEKLPNIVGGTADVALSTKSYIKDGGEYSKDFRRGRNICFGVREHAMAGIANGISLYAGLKVFVSTFFSFSNYLFPALRMSAIMKQPILYFFTHDSIMVGEDGETHQPIEQLGAIRQIPDVNVVRPCCVSELIAGYNLALNGNKPTCFVLSKHELTNYDSNVANASKGGYILEKDSGKISLAIYATGSEVELALSVKKEMNKLGVKVAVVSFPCLEVFEKQSEQYKNSCLIKEAKARIAIEASSDTVWYKYLGNNGRLINITSFGKSGRGTEIYKKYGFSVANVKKEISKILKF